MGRLLILACSLSWILGIVPSDALASDELCLEFKSMLLGERFIAKVPLYDTKIEVSGIAKLERDKEEVPEGAMLQVLKVECEGDKLEVKIKELAEHKTESADIVFRFASKFKKLPNPVGDLRIMMDLVFEQPDQN